MESVKRYDCTNGKTRHCYGCYEMTELPNGEYVSGDDFDRVSAENLALQQRLTVQDQRVDELLSAVRDNHEWHKLYDEYDGYAGSSIEQTNIAALKPTAETDLCQQN